MNDVLQVYVAILPIDNNTYKLRNTVYERIFDRHKNLKLKF